MESKVESRYFLLPDDDGGTFFYQSEVSSVTIQSDKAIIRLKNNLDLEYVPDVSRYILGSEVVKLSLMMLGSAIFSSKISDIIKNYRSPIRGPHRLQDMFDSIVSDFSDSV